MAKKKVENLFIGTDITRTADLSGFPEAASATLATGEILVLDEFKNIITTGDTIDDTDTIYIVEGLSGTFDYVTPNGTAVTGAKQLLTSKPIQGVAVTEWSGKSYAAPTEKVMTLTGSLTPVVGEEYVLRVVYTDVYEHPGQFTKTYRYVATSTSQDTLYTALASEINSDPYARVTAVATTSPSVLTLTAKTYGDNEALDSIDEYKQVIFDVFLQSDNFDSVVTTATANPSEGFGHWRVVRDEEKWAQGYDGVLNRTLFPTNIPAFRTVIDETYDCLIIRHKNWYTTAGEREEQVDITTKIYVPVGAGQATNILADLNPWMASLPKAFPTVSV